MKIAAFGLAAGAAVMLTATAPVLARGAGGFGPLGDGFAGRDGGVFTVQFTDLDTDGDGRITEAELTARARALVDARLADVDTDGDGVVSAAEIEAQALARIEARIAAPVAGRQTGPRSGDPAAIAKTIAERMIAARDTDGDGMLSGEELAPGTGFAGLVDRFDTDDDNAWDAQEFAAVKARGARGFGDRDGRGGHDRGDWRDGVRGGRR